MRKAGGGGGTKGSPSPCTEDFERIEPGSTEPDPIGVSSIVGEPGSNDETDVEGEGLSLSFGSALLRPSGPSEEAGAPIASSEVSRLGDSRAASGVMPSEGGITRSLRASPDSGGEKIGAASTLDPSRPIIRVAAQRKPGWLRFTMHPRGLGHRNHSGKDVDLFVNPCPLNTHALSDPLEEDQGKAR